MYKPKQKRTFSLAHGGSLDSRMRDRQTAWMEGRGKEQGLVGRDEVWPLLGWLDAQRPGTMGVCKVGVILVGVSLLRVRASMRVFTPAGCPAPCFQRCHWGHHRTHQGKSAAANETALTKMPGASLGVFQTTCNSGQLATILGIPMTLSGMSFY